MSHLKIDRCCCIRTQEVFREGALAAEHQSSKLVGGTNKRFEWTEESLIVKKDGVVVEAVQVKNVVADLTTSSLAATKTSKGGEVFFNRMCSLHMQNKSFSNIRIVYLGELGTELQEVKDNIDSTKKSGKKVGG